VAQRFDEIGISIKNPLHCVMANFQYFCFLDGDDVGGSWLTGEKGHFAEKGAIVQRCDGSRSTVLGNLDANLAVMHNEHRRTWVARVNNDLIRGKNVTCGGLGQHRDLVKR
jgi:hypothetical protein